MALTFLYLLFGTARLSAQAPDPAPPGAAPASQVTSEKSFNPALSVILDGLYYTDDREGTVGELERGFSLREAEIVFSGSVDRITSGNG